MTAGLQDRPVLALFCVLGASVCFGVVPYFARSLTDAGLAPAAIAFFRYGATVVLLLPFLWAVRGQTAAVAWGLSAGLLLAFGWVSYVMALQTEPVSTTGVLYMTYPVFTLLIGWGLFRDKPSGRAWVGAVIVILAALVASYPLGQTSWRLWMALGAPLGFGYAINILVHRINGLPVFSRIAVVSSGGFLGLLPMVVLTPVDQVIPDDPSLWGLIIGIALVTAIVPQVLYTISVPVIGGARAAMAGSIELPTMFVVGVLAFGETLTMAQWVAGGLIVFAIWVTRPRGDGSSGLFRFRKRLGLR